MEGLAVDGLHVSFGPVRALTGMDVHVGPGQLVGFLGPNGSGKTTTMRAILGLVAVQAGHVRWSGRPIDDRARRTIGYMPEERGLYPRMKVHDQVTYFGRLAGLGARAARDAAAAWLERSASASGWAASSRTSRTATSNGCSSRWPSCTNRCSSCSTSRSPVSIPWR